MGFYIRPGAGKHNWVEQTKEIQNRVQCVQAVRASLKLNAHTLNARVVPCVSFVVQLGSCEKGSHAPLYKIT